MDRIFNFGAGPSCLPIEVLRTIQNELLNYKNSGMSILEISHRNQLYNEINDEARSLFKKLLNIDDNWSVLYLQGGAYTQFSTFPQNFADKNDLTLYAITGNFSNKAYIEGKKYTKAEILVSSEDTNFNYIPKIDKNMVDQTAKYVHICVNNTVYGTCYDEIPDTGSVPLVGDMSSIILGKDYDINKFAMIYGGAQKNLGAAGVTFLAIRNNMINENLKNTLAAMSDYSVHKNADSIFNTPPVFAVYVLNLMLKWVEKMGGVKSLSKRAVERSNILYDIIDNSNFYNGTANIKYRSPMNITFICPTKELNDKFVSEAKSNGLIGVKGHKAAGGIRVSIYNAMEDEGVKKISEFMKKFEIENK